jgi:glutathione S-transferase
MKVYQWASEGVLPNSSPFCMKLETYLKIMKIDHTIVPTNNIGKSPKKTMPYIEVDGLLISDSQFIIEMLEKKQQNPMDGFLDDKQKALALCVRYTFENELVYILMYYRWLVEKGWNTFSRVMFSNVPSVVRILVGGILRKSVLKTLHSQGVSRHSEEEILSKSENIIAAASSFLGTNSFFFGEKVSTLDLVVYSMVANVLYGGVENPLIEQIKKHQNLVEHSSRVLKLGFDRSF